jgi:hypothetical protein
MTTIRIQSVRRVLVTRCEFSAGSVVPFLGGKLGVWADILGFGFCLVMAVLVVPVVPLLLLFSFFFFLGVWSRCVWSLCVVLVCGLAVVLGIRRGSPWVRFRGSSGLPPIVPALRSFGLSVPPLSWIFSITRSTRSTWSTWSLGPSITGITFDQFLFRRKPTQPDPPPTVVRSFLLRLIGLFEEPKKRRNPITLKSGNH